MERLVNVIVGIAVALMSPLGHARYAEELASDNSGAWMFVYVIMAFIGVGYIREQMKISSSAGMTAVAIVSALAVAAFVFPIVNGILVFVIGLAVTYAFFKML